MYNESTIVCNAWAWPAPTWAHKFVKSKSRSHCTCRNIESLFECVFVLNKDIKTTSWSFYHFCFVVTIICYGVNTSIGGATVYELMSGCHMRNKKWHFLHDNDMFNVVNSAWPIYQTTMILNSSTLDTVGELWTCREWITQSQVKRRSTTCWRRLSCFIGQW